MMIVPFKPEHLTLIDMQEQQITARDILRDQPGLAGMLRSSGDAYTVLVDGQPIICAGLLNVGDGRAHAWALFAQHSGRYFVKLIRYIGRYLDTVSFRRIEATVDVRFFAAIRLANILGFEREGVMKAYGRDGGDHYLYARVK